MKKLYIFIIIVLLIITIFMLYLIKGKKADKINIEAASAFYPFAASLVENINSDYLSENSVKMVSTSDAFNDIVKGKTDFIIATEPSDQQKEIIKSSNVDLEFKPLYLEPLIIFVNKDNNVKNLRIFDIKKIYNSDCNWNGYGGEAGIINTYQLEKNNGSQTCFESIIKGNTLGKHHIELQTMPEIVDNVALDKNGIGYAFYSYYFKMHKNNGVKVINVDNENVESKGYPLLYDVYLIYNKKSINEKMLSIINLLESETGKEIINIIK